MASTSSLIPDHDQGGPISFPKPPSPDLPTSPVQHFVAELTDVAPPPTDPPPPYPSGPRTNRRSRANTTRSARRSAQVSDDSQIGSLQHDSGAESETSPLLGGRRRRTTSHSSTIHSVGSLAQTVISSSMTVISLFQADTDACMLRTAGSTSDLPFLARAKRYFRPLMRRPYYAALFHLLFINFPFELVAWIFLFVGTLVSLILPWLCDVAVSHMTIILRLVQHS
jgi:hypothetical protein